MFVYIHEIAIHCAMFDNSLHWNDNSNKCKLGIAMYCRWHRHSLKCLYFGVSFDRLSVQSWTSFWQNENTAYLPACTAILRQLIHHDYSLRHKLAKDRDIYMCLLRGKFHCFLETYILRGYKNAEQTTVKTHIIRDRILAMSSAKFYSRDFIFATCHILFCNPYIRFYWRGLYFHVSMLSRSNAKIKSTNKKCFTVIVTFFFCKFSTHWPLWSKTFGQKL